MKQEKEKCRVLEESLNVLAKEHHQLEQSVASHLSENGDRDVKNFLESNDEDEFHDAFNDDGEGKENAHSYVLPVNASNQTTKKKYKKYFSFFRFR